MSHYVEKGEEYEFERDGVGTLLRSMGFFIFLYILLKHNSFLSA